MINKLIISINQSKKQPDVFFPAIVAIAGYTLGFYGIITNTDILISIIDIIIGTICIFLFLFLRKNPRSILLKSFIIICITITCMIASTMASAETSKVITTIIPELVMIIYIPNILSIIVLYLIYLISLHYFGIFYIGIIHPAFIGFQLVLLVTLVLQRIQARELALITIKQEFKINEARRIERVIQNIIHELKNLSRGSEGSLPYILDIIKESKLQIQQKDMLSKGLSSQSKDLKNLVEELSIISNNKKHQSILKKQPINTIIDKIIKELQIYIESNRYNISINNIIEYSELNINSAQISIVMRNIIMNSIHELCNSRHGKINIKGIATLDKYELLISDNGQGFPIAVLDLYNNPQANPIDLAFTTKESGTGLGLGVILQVVHNHNGKLKLSNKDGAVISIELPI